MSLAFDPHGDLIVVPTKLWGPAGDVVARLALDTGAVQSVVSWEIAILIGYDPASVTARVRIITGSAIEYVPQIEVGKVEAIDQVRQDIAILCDTLPAGATVDGVLGLDFIRGHRLIIDFQTGVVELL